MIEYIILGIIVILILIIFLIIAWSFYQKQEILREKEDNRYRLERRKLYNDLKKKSRAPVSDDDDAADFIDSLPSWLSSIAQGANIDLQAVYEGDPGELAKIKDLLDKNLPKKGFDDGEILLQ